MASSVIGALRVNLGIDTAAFDDGMKGVRDRMKSVGKSMAKVGAGMSAAITAPIMGLGVATLKTAGDFEASMNRLAAAAGATESELAAMKSMAMTLGKETSKSASESADAMEMLAKNGLTAGQILGGAADASLKLSEATGGDLSQAADVATNVMAQFRIEAEDLGRVVDGITGVTLQSQFGFEDYALALAQAGGVAGAIGVSLEDFNAAIAATSSVFSSGSDAGTSYKNFLTRLIPASDAAAASMSNLGLVFFETDGSMKSMTAIAEELRLKMGGLSDEALSEAMKDIFGVDGMRTAIALMEQGGAGVEAFRAKIADASAEEQAAARMKGFNGELEQMKGAFETLQLAIADSGLLEFVTGLVTKLADFISRLSQTNPELLKWGTIASGVAAALGPLLIALGLMLTALAAVSAPVLAFVAGLAAASAAVAAFWPQLNVLKGHIQTFLAASGPERLAIIGQAFVALKDNALAALEALVGGAKTWLVDKMNAVIDMAMDPIRRLGAGIKGLYDDAVGHSWIPDMVMGIEDWMGRLGSSFGNSMAGLTDSTLNWRDALSGLGPVASDIGSKIQSSFSGAFDSLVQGSFNAKEAVIPLLKDLTKLALNSAFQSLLGSVLGASGGGGMNANAFSAPGIPWSMGSFDSGLPGFANGGSFKVGGSGGIDSKLIAFRASPGEMVDVRKPGNDNGGGTTVNVNVRNEPGIESEVQKRPSARGGFDIEVFTRRVKKEMAAEYGLRKQTVSR